jgi:hypothetical protein
MIEEGVGRYVLLLNDGGIEHSLGGGSTRWLLRLPCWQAHTRCVATAKYSGPVNHLHRVNFADRTSYEVR